MEDLGRRIYTARKALNLTLEIVGQYVGVGKSTVRKWENGIIKNMRRDKIKKLSEILQVSPGYLMGWTDNPGDYHTDSENTTLIPSAEQQSSDLCLSDFEREIITKLRLLSVDQQKVFLAYLTTLLNTQAP